MLQRDYVLEIVGQFVEGVSRALRRAARGEKNGLLDAEREIGELLDLEPQTALALAPDSLVTMMVLSGIGDSIAAHVCYALDRVAESFGCDPAEPPAELVQLDAELFPRA